MAKFKVSEGLRVQTTDVIDSSGNFVGVRLIPTSTQATTSTTTGALVITGGAGIGGGLFVGGAITATSFTGVITTATNLAGGTAGAIHYQVSPGVSGFIGTGATGSLLQMGATTASFVSTSTIQVGYSVHLLGGTAGSLLYQSAANATTFLTIGGAGTILTSSGTGPAYTLSLIHI